MLPAASNAMLLIAALTTMSHVAHADVRAAHTSLVSENASFFTPGAIDGRVQAIAIDGDTVFVGGTFTQIQMALDGEIVNQPYLFAYSKSTGAILQDFDPILNNAVFALQTTGEGTGIFAGGAFTTVNGETNRKGLIKLDDFGDRVQSFSARPNKRVYTMDRSGSTLYIGGNFENVSQVPVEFLAALDTTTGELLPNINLDFDGFFSTTRATGVPSVQDIEVSSSDELMVVVGNFESINGISRSRLALIELGDQAQVSDWNTDVFDFTCPGRNFPQYILGLDMAPDDSYFVTATSGFRRIGVPACDSVLRFDLDDLTNTDVQPTWRSMTGGDSVYEVAATEHAVYAGGHFRWFNNDLSVDGRSAGPGAVARAGLAALDPLNGLPLLDWQAPRNPRGRGTFSLEVQPEGLYIGDDTDFLNGFRHPKFKFLSISADTVARPSAPSLPTSIFSVVGATLDATTFDGVSLGTPVALSSEDWSSSRGAMFLGGKLFHADNNGDMWVSLLREDDTFGPRSQVDLFGLTPNEWNLAQLGGMFFDYELGRVYYSLEGDSRLFWRAFTPAGPIFGENQFIADDQSDIPWANVQGMDVVDGKLYFGSTDGNLYRATINGTAPVSGTTEVVSVSGIDGQDWSNPLLTFSSQGVVLTPPELALFEFESVGSSTFRAFQQFQFPVEAGQPIDVRLTWDNPNAQLNVFLRDANGQLVEFDNNSTETPKKWVSAPAGDGGVYTVSVKIQEGSTAYTVSVNPAEERPAPLADFVFNATGSVDTNRWRVFSFDVEAGDLVEAQVIWDDPDTSLRVFLRDESSSPVDRDIDGSGSPETVSAVAATSGRWSIGVRIQTGGTEYDVLVNTTSNGTSP